MKHLSVISHCVKKIIPIMEFCIEMSYFHQVLYVFLLQGNLEISYDWKYCTRHNSIPILYKV